MKWSISRPPPLMTSAYKIFEAVSMLQTDSSSSTKKIVFHLQVVPQLLVEEEKSFYESFDEAIDASELLIQLENACRRIWCVVRSDHQRVVEYEDQSNEEIENVSDNVQVPNITDFKSLSVSTESRREII